MLQVQTIIKAVGPVAVLVISMLLFYFIARLRLDPWWLTLILAAPLGLVILSGIPWLLSGGERGTDVEIRHGDRSVTVTNWNVFARNFARTALTALHSSPVPLPPASGSVVSGKSPAQDGSVIEAEAALPPGVAVTEKPIEIPKEAAQLS